MKLTVDSKSYKKKPVGYEAGNVQSRCINSREVNVQELKELILAGHTIRDAVVSGRHENDWVQQEIFIVDIDNSKEDIEKDKCKYITVEQAIEKYKHLNPFMVYTTFSHTESHHKFRILFKTQKPYTDFGEAKNIHLRLMNTIKECDEKCKNLGRLYFAGYNVVYVNENAYLNIEGLSKEEYSKTIEKPKKNKDNNTTLIKREHNDIYKYIIDMFPINDDVLELSIQDYYEYILSYDMHKLIGEYSNNFGCVLPTHNDSNPSAGIIKDEDSGHYIYHCFGCGASYNNIQLIEILLNSKNRVETLKWFEEKLGIKKIDSEFIRSQKEKIDIAIEYIQSGQLRKDYPDVYKIIGRYIPRLISMYTFAKGTLFNEKYVNEDGEHIFYASTRKIQKDVFGIKSMNTTNRVIQVFNLLDFVNKIAPEDLPTNIYEEAIKHMKKGRITNHYLIPNLNVNQLSKMDEKAKILKKSKFTNCSMSYEAMVRNQSTEEANKLYPQEAKKNKNFNKTDQIAIYILDIISKVVTEKGYITQNEIYELGSSIGKTKIKQQWKKSITYILDGYGYDMVKATKANKEKYGIPKSVHFNTSIIVKEK